MFSLSITRVHDLAPSEQTDLLPNRLEVSQSSEFMNQEKLNIDPCCVLLSPSFSSLGPGNVPIVSSAVQLADITENDLCVEGGRELESAKLSEIGRREENGDGAGGLVFSRILSSIELNTKGQNWESSGKDAAVEAFGNLLPCKESEINLSANKSDHFVNIPFDSLTTSNSQCLTQNEAGATEVALHSPLRQSNELLESPVSSPFLSNFKGPGSPSINLEILNRQLSTAAEHAWSLSKTVEADPIQVQPNASCKNDANIDESSAKLELSSPSAVHDLSRFPWLRFKPEEISLDSDFECNDFPTDTFAFGLTSRIQSARSQFWESVENISNHLTTLTSNIESSLPQNIMHSILDEPASRLRHLLFLNKDVMQLEKDVSVQQVTVLLATNFYLKKLRKIEVIVNSKLQSKQEKEALLCEKVKSILQEEGSGFRMVTSLIS